MALTELQLEYQRRYREKHRDRKRASTLKWIKNNPEKHAKNVREWCWKQQGIKITFEEYNKLFVMQYGKCSICKVHQNNLKRTLVVDHDHKNGKIRGLLCQNCNTALGHAKESISILESMIHYLREDK